MNKTRKKNDAVVQSDHEAQTPEKMWFVQLGQVRRHSRTLYVPLDASIVNLYKIKKGDKIKYILLQLIRAPAEDSHVSDPGAEQS